MSKSKKRATSTQGTNAKVDSLASFTADGTDQLLTTNQGVKINDNQNSLKAGERGGTLLEDFILREKITHFDHERIPERIVHARGSGAHGYFECYKPLTKLTRAAPFAEAACGIAWCGSGFTAWTRSGNFIASWMKNTGMLLPTRSQLPSSV